MSFFTNLKKSNSTSILYQDFDKLEIGKKYIIELPHSPTGERYVHLIPETFNEKEKILRCRIFPKCVGIINMHGFSRISKILYLSQERFKKDFDLYRNNT